MIFVVHLATVRYSSSSKDLACGNGEQDTHEALCLTLVRDDGKFRPYQLQPLK